MINQEINVGKKKEKETVSQVVRSARERKGSQNCCYIAPLCTGTLIRWLRRWYSEGTRLCL